MKHQDLCPDCQKKMPIMDYDKAVEVIRGVIELDKTYWQTTNISTIRTYEIVDDLARLAHEAIYSTKED